MQPLLLLLSSAFADPAVATAEVGAFGDLFDPIDAPLGPRLGLGARAALLPVPWWTLETEATASPASSSLVAWRAHTGPRWASGPFALGALAGVSNLAVFSRELGADLDLAGHGGVYAASMLGRALGVRADARVHLTGRDGTALVVVPELTAGIVVRFPGPEEPAPVPVVAAAPEPAAPPARTAPELPPIEPAEARVWVPHPYCEWLDPQAAAELVRSSEGVRVVRIAAPGRVALEVPLDGAAQAVVLPEAPALGGLVVAAAPGDRVSLDGELLVVDPTGVALGTAPGGDHVVEIVGGGRRERLDVALADRQTLWLPATPPATVEIRFSVGSAELSRAEREALKHVAEAAGDHAFRLRGMASPEGEEVANEALAGLRAEAVRDALASAGIAPERLRLDPPAVGGSGDPSELRRVDVVPLTVEDEP
ncbi:MAG: OmpA family protein [Myxococcales bacterium]|nr:OmpA family protein [Myxococcales bacterium]